MTGVIRWEDPTPSWSTGARSPERIPWALIAAELRDRPGKWAVVHEGGSAPHVAVRIKQGKTPWFRPAGAFEAIQRTRDGEVAIYARYVGEPSPEVKR